MSRGREEGTASGEGVCVANYWQGNFILIVRTPNGWEDAPEGGVWVTLRPA